MTNQAILTKAINLAIAGGWDYAIVPQIKNMKETIGDVEYIFTSKSWSVRDELLWVNVSYKGGVHAYCSRPVEFIFNHDFAKAIWPDISLQGAEVLIDENVPPNMLYSMPAAPLTAKKPWQFHLQQMVIADDPIAYLGEHLPQWGKCKKTS